ncbi:hypothetical protein ACVIGB_008062 [Bradyrhizobium sp. USDA 4341]
MRSRVLLLEASETAAGSVRLVRRLYWADKSVAGTSTSFTDPYGQPVYGDADRFDVMRRHNPHLSLG